MDLYFLLPALLGTLSAALSAGSSAPAGDTRASVGHVRTKRCSCATFLDKECVYFCHLDIIWVNTPERVVSYGLGNAPRTKRSLQGPLRTGPRCRCLREDDQTCSNFCQREQLHGDKSETIRSVHTQECSKGKCKHTLPLNSGQSRPDRVLSPKLRAALRTRTLLEKWRMRRRNRSRTRDTPRAAAAA